MKSFLTKVKRLLKNNIHTYQIFFLQKYLREQQVFMDLAGADRANVTETPRQKIAKLEVCRIMPHLWHFFLLKRSSKKV